MSRGKWRYGHDREHNWARNLFRNSVFRHSNELRFRYRIKQKKKAKTKKPES